jgi:hypothetical protein
LASNGATPPLPLSATYDLSSGVVAVLFDAPLAPHTLNATLWLVRRNAPNSRSVTTAVAAAETVTLTTSPSIFPDTINTVEYLGGDPLLTGITGLPVGPFTVPYSDIP